MKNNKKRIILPILIIFFILVIISCVLFLWYTLSGNYINIGHTDNSADNATTSEAANSNVIIVNGVVLGASNSLKWVSAEKFYDANSNKAELEVDVFATNAQYGTYKTASIKKYNKSVIYTTIAKEGIPNSYLALTATDDVKILPGMTKLEVAEDDVKYVKEAIGSYKLINGSVKVLEVYGTNIKGVTDKIICATSENANLLGAYSAVVYVTGGKAYLVKYAYVRDTKNSDRWPIYSLQFVMDLNADTKPELVLQETTGNDTTYSVLELRENNVFYEVLRSTIAL
ncbi:MAG: hypothetical protein IJ272_03745 [Clostridia bacterium]|nr:hypothetical protein [Clostridia bacterium]